MTLIDDYLEEQIKHESIYGSNTIVLMQVGHFYECYGVDNTEESVNSDNLHRLSDILNIQLTRKNKSILENSRKNPMMIGVNIYSIEKYIQLLLNNNYTCVMVDQVTEPPDPKRAITNIHSPGTNIIYTSKGDSSNLMTIYIETFVDLFKKTQITVGISLVDLSTGKNMVFETHSNSDDFNRSLDETFRFIQSYDPKEIILVVDDKHMDLKKDFLIKYLELNGRVVHFKMRDDINKEFYNLNYQKVFLEKIFKNCGLLTVIEYLDLETKQVGLLSYVILLDFAYKHNELIVGKINVPSIYDENQNLILTNNCINQLNLVAHHSSNNGNNGNNGISKFNSLYGVLNNCSTSLGRRLLKDRLLHPIISVDKLNRRYSMIEALISCNHNGLPIYQEVEKSLMKIMDIERLFRKMGLGLLQPADFAGLDYSCNYITELLGYIKSNKQLSTILNNIIPSERKISEFYNLIHEYTREFEFNEIAKYHLDKITGSFFKTGIHEEIDTLQAIIDKNKLIFEKVAIKLSDLIDGQNNYMVKVEHNDRDGYFLNLTTKRSQILKKKFSNIQYKPLKINIDGDYFIEYNIKNIQFKTTTKTTVRIGCDYLKGISNELVLSKYKIGSVCRRIYLETIERWHNKYSESCLNDIVEFIAEIDVIKSGAKTASLYGYMKPCINDVQDGESYIDTEAIRHPIIERIQTDIEYVTNNIKLDNGQKGILLYGTNASGKSSLMKAMGLNVIMAQAGFFVAASRFQFWPYKYLFTRINNNDNLFKGESSFAVEMSELRSILKRSTANSLILGDELCSGTESISAQSIFSASVIKLIENNSSFIFATHLHELCRMPIITEIPTLKIFHLKVEYNEETGKLRYDRKLEPGSGPAIYGLEVCKAMNMSPDFLDLAQTIRRNLMDMGNNVVSTKKSKYNAKVFVDRCMVCQELAEDVHHIKFQCCANINNIIDGHIQKDIKSNLVPLCKECHDKVHNKGIEINGFIQTSDGIELDFKYLTGEELKEKVKNRKKYSDSDLKIIGEMSRQLSKKMVCNILEKEHNIKISYGTLNKIWMGNY